MILKALSLPFSGDGGQHCPCTTTALRGVDMTHRAFVLMCNQFEWFHTEPISAVLSARHRANRSIEGRKSHDF